MSDEDFLSRWSRRKREAKADLPAPEAILAVETPAEPTIDAPGEPDFDLSTLPPIDSITAATDITAFLRKGIPQELTRAALRRAWSSDPVIRDFVGLAENAWDFNDPTAMPGFGPLDCTAAELNAMAERIVGGVREVAERVTSAVAQSEPIVQNAAPEGETAQGAYSTPVEADPAELAAEPEQSAAASQQAMAEAGEHVLRRRHGGALPRNGDDALLV